MVASWALSQEIGANYIACYHEPRWKRPNLCLDEIFDVVSLLSDSIGGDPPTFARRIGSSASETSRPIFRDCIGRA
jgi:hypothetical protein